MFRKFSSVVLILGFLFVIGCMTHVHKVGNGAAGNDITEARQWYVLWGLIPINDLGPVKAVDTNAMAAGATDYEIMTQTTLIDVIINIVLSEITVTSRTVTVRK